MSPMMFAQTIVELPKYGARRRDAAISVASVPVPAVKTTSPSRARPTVARVAPCPRASAASRASIATKSACQPKADDGAVVVRLAAGERAAVGEDRLGERLRREGGVCREERVQALGAVELAVAPRLDHAVRVEDHGRTVL